MVIESYLLTQDYFVKSSPYSELYLLVKSVQDVFDSTFSKAIFTFIFQ